MYEKAITIENDGIRNAYLPIVRNYRAKAVALDGVTDAVADGDLPAVRRYERKLNRRVTEAQAMAERLIDDLHNYMSGEELEELLGERKRLMAP